METLKKIEKIIIERAEKRAFADIQEFGQAIQKSGILELKDLFTIESKSKEPDDKYFENIRSGLWVYDTVTNIATNKSPIGVLYRELVKKYTDQEAQKFVNDVERLTAETNKLLSLSDDVEEIRNNQNYQ